MDLILCFSPHLDDAILSCAAKLLSEKRQGKRLRVETIFTEDKDKKSQWSKFNYQDRRDEDNRALARLGAEVVHWQFLDAPFRNSAYHDWLSIVTHFEQGDGSVQTEIKNRMWDVIKSEMPKEILLPLGIGGHIDHRLVFAAGVELCQEKNIWDKVLFYEDRPYVLVDGALEARLFSLGLKNFSSFLKLIPTYVLSLIGFEMTKSQTPGWLSRYQLAALVLFNSFKARQKKMAIQNLTSQVSIATPDDIKEISFLVQAYSSQFGDLYFNEKYFLEKSQKYSQKITAKSDIYGERYWRGSSALPVHENT